MAALSRRSRPHVPTPEEEGLAAWLVQRAQGAPVAWVDDGETVWWARGPSRPERTRTAVTALVLGLGTLDPDGAHHRLRHRVLTTAPRRLLDAEVVRSGARRWSVGVYAASLPRAARRAVEVTAWAWSWPDPSVLRALSLGDRMRSVHEALDRADGLAAVDTSVPRRRRDRPVGALLVGADGRVLGASRNRGGAARTRHAELDLVQRWEARTGRPLPEGAWIAVGLQPCRMCACALRDAAGVGGVRIWYRRPDPGRGARGGVLEALGWARPEPRDARSSSRRIGDDVP